MKLAQILENKKVIMIYAAEINDCRSRIDFDKNRHLILQLISFLFDGFNSYLPYYVVCRFQKTYNTYFGGFVSFLILKKKVKCLLCVATTRLVK